ncbi:MAG: hypothetical protein J5988_10065 [Eubacterium sp.]|nr:hypothetical protein [Eubacterium sp.]
MTEKYKALLYREWKISRRFYLLRVLLLLLFDLMVIGVFIGGFKANEMSQAEGNFMYLLFSYFAVVLGGAIIGEDNGVYKADVDTGWFRFSQALPLTAVEKAVTRYLFKGLVLIIGSLMIFVPLSVIYGMTKFAHVATVVYLFFFALDAILLYEVVRYILTMCISDADKSRRVRRIVGVGMFVIWIILEICILTGVSNSNLLVTSEELNDFARMLDVMTIPNRWGWVSIPLLFVLLAVGFLTTWKSYERRNA